MLGLYSDDHELSMAHRASYNDYVIERFTPYFEPHRAPRRYRSPTSTTAVAVGFSRSIRSSEASSSSRAEISRARGVAAS